MTLKWREQLSVANDVIDGDHKFLIDIINRAERSMIGRDSNSLRAALDDLSQYSRVHFEREEKIAEAVGYTQVPGLHQSHTELVAKLDHMRGEIDAMGAAWSVEAVAHFGGFLRDWLIDHVIKEDLLMRPVLQKYSPSYDPR